MAEDGGAVNNGVLVVSRSQASPLLGVAEAALDHVAAPVILGIESARASTA